MLMPWVFISFFFDWMVATTDMNRCFSFANFKMFFNVIATFCGYKVDKETYKGSKNNLPCQFPKRIGKASSEQAMKIAIKVPIVKCPLQYKSAPTTEMPH